MKDLSNQYYLMGSADDFQKLLLDTLTFSGFSPKTLANAAQHSLFFRYLEVTSPSEFVGFSYLIEHRNDFPEINDFVLPVILVADVCFKERRFENELALTKANLQPTPWCMFLHIVKTWLIVE